MSFAIEEYRAEVDEKYVGVNLDTTKVKPVHIANGLFRTALGETNSTKMLHRFVLHTLSKTGAVPKGHEIDSVYESLLDAEAIEDSIGKENLQTLRRKLKRVLAADDGIFTGQMQSYSAGNSAFLSKDTIGQDGGEFVTCWLEHIDSPLLKQIRMGLRDPEDIVTQICQPLLVEDSTEYQGKSDFDSLKFVPSSFGRRNKNKTWAGLQQAAETLSARLEKHPDKLFRLRLSVLFASVVVIRHVASLESYYESGDAIHPPPFVVDIDGLRDAAKQSYSGCTRAIAGFYGLAFGETLKRNFSIAELGKIKSPKYKDLAKQKCDIQGESIWRIKRDQAKSAKNKYRVFGDAVFDILSLQKTSADPIRYFRGIGRRTGLLYPPTGASVPWFALKHELPELLVYCCVDEDESIEFPDFCDRLWERFGMIVGGGRMDERLLEENGIYSWDRDALRGNQHAFATQLADRGYARELADGVMKVSLEVHV